MLLSVDGAARLNGTASALSSVERVVYTAQFWPGAVSPGPNVSSTVTAWAGAAQSAIDTANKPPRLVSSSRRVRRWIMVFLPRMEIPSYQRLAVHDHPPKRGGGRIKP